MAIYRNNLWSVERPNTATYLLIAVNIAVFGLCLSQSGSAAIPSDVLFRYGAMYSLAIERHEYWRLVTHAFLHTNLLHLATNMICLVLWGGHLEKRVGAFYFLLIYLCAIIAGAITSNQYHSGNYLSVGASGGVSGVLGALLCLWILAKVDLSLNFFVINIGLNVAIAATVARVDWAAHFGGFTVGLIVCALIDVVVRTTKFALRCKFPEFVKINGFVIGATLGLLLWDFMPSATPSAIAIGWWVTYGVACCVAIKLVDLVLSNKKGLAIVVVTFAVANSGLVLYAGGGLTTSVNQACMSQTFARIEFIAAVLNVVCAHWGTTVIFIAASTFAITIVAYSHELRRGIEDIRFVGASLTTERKRRDGI